MADIDQFTILESELTQLYGDMGGCYVGSGEVEIGRCRKKGKIGERGERKKGSLASSAEKNKEGERGCKDINNGLERWNGPLLLCILQDVRPTIFSNKS